MTSGDRTNCYGLLGAHILHMHKEHTHFLPFSLFHTHTHKLVLVPSTWHYKWQHILSTTETDISCSQQQQRHSSNNKVEHFDMWTEDSIELLLLLLLREKFVIRRICTLATPTRHIAIWQRHMAWRAHFNGALINDPPPLQKLR